MRRYTLFAIRDGRLMKQSPVSAACDVTATEMAWEIASEAYCELWDGERLVAFIARDERGAVA